MTRARWGLAVAGVAVSAGLAYLAVRDVRLAELREALEESDYWWLAPAVAVLGVANVVRAWRWQVMFERRTRPPFGPALSALLVGTFFNNLLPARAGEAAQVVALKQRAGGSAAEAAATVVLGRVYDVLSVLLLLLVLAPWLPEVGWLRAGAVVAGALAAVLLGLGLATRAFGDRPLRALLRPLARLPFVSPPQTARAAAGVSRGLASVRDPRLAASALVLTAAGWVLFGVSNWLVMRGFDLGLSPLAGLLVTIALGVATVLPSSPAALGVFEAATVLSLEAYGVPRSQALSYALVLHAVNFLPYVAAGLVCLNLGTLGSGLRGRRA